MKTVATLVYSSQKRTNQVKMYCLWTNSPQYLFLRQKLGKQKTKNKKPELINSQGDKALAINRKISPFTFSVSSLNTEIQEAVFLFYEQNKRSLLSNEIFVFLVVES